MMEGSMDITFFDWVTARSKCSLQHLFLMLGEVVDGNVTAMNKLKRPDLEFDLKRDETKLIVGRKRDFGGYSETFIVVLELAAEVGKITATLRGPKTDKLLFAVTPELNPDGECFLRVVGLGDSLSLWQVSRKALEDLFFGE